MCFPGQGPVSHPDLVTRPGSEISLVGKPGVVQAIFGWLIFCQGDGSKNQPVGDEAVGIRPRFGSPQRRDDKKHDRQDGKEGHTPFHRCSSTSRAAGPSSATVDEPVREARGDRQLRWLCSSLLDHTAGISVSESRLPGV